MQPTGTAPIQNGSFPSPFIQKQPDSPAPLAQEQQTVKIPLTQLMQEDEPENKSISFKKSADLSAHIAKPTVEPTPPVTPAVNQYANMSTDQLRTQMINEEMGPIEQMAPADFQLIAGFIIDAWDLGTVTLFRMYAMDNSDAPYEMTKSKKAKLKELLALILIRFNKKFPLGVLFFMTLLLTSITPAMKAHEHRKQVQALNKTKPRPKKGTTTKVKKKTGPKPKAEAAPSAADDAKPKEEAPGVVDPDEIQRPPKSQGAQSK